MNLKLIKMKEYHGFNSEQEYEEYAQLMWLINNNK
jgi:hypothetical protein